MPTPTPAMIKYKSAEGIDQELRFHTVISEDHEAHSEITKFPVQTGFSVSNHAIRKNRKVIITGVISNTLIAGSKTAYQYSLNNQATVFRSMIDLVNNATLCEVVTNLSVYNPVVFNKFKTKQSAGKVDSMEFTITGEEIQVKSTLNRTAPKLLNFKLVSDASYPARIVELEKQGYDVSKQYVPDTADENAGNYIVARKYHIEESTTELGTDFIIESKDIKGKTKATTYLYKGYDPVTQTYKYDVHIEDHGIVKSTATQINLFALVGKAASTTSACLVDGSLDAAIDISEDLVSTTMGDLRESVYGFRRELVKLGGGQLGQTLVGLGVDCAIAGLEDGFDSFADEVLPGSAIASAVGLPTTQAIINQLTVYGQEEVAVPLKKFLITKVDGFGGAI